MFHPSARRLVTTANSGKKTTDSIETSFGVAGRVGLKNDVLVGVQIPNENEQILGEMGLCNVKTYRENAASATRPVNLSNLDTQIGAAQPIALSTEHQYYAKTGKAR